MANAKPKAAVAEKLPRAISRANVRRVAETWFALFEGYSHDLIDREASDNENVEKLDTAVKLADRAMELFEERWPGVYL